MAVNTYIRLFIIFICICYFPAGVGQTLPSAQQIETQPLIISMGDESFPYQYIDDHGKPRGYLVDLWRAWAETTGREIQFVPRRWGQSIKNVEKGQADIHAGLAKTPERQARFQFSNPLVDVTSYLYLNKKIGKIDDMKHLSGYTIGIVRNSAHKEMLNQLLVRPIYRIYESRNELLDAATKGEILVFAGLEGYLRKRSRLQDIVSLFPYENRIKIKAVSVYAAVNHSNQVLLSQINRGFTEVPHEKLAVIMRKWIGIGNSVSGVSVALKKNHPPFSVEGFDGSPHGMYVDLWQEWAKRTNTKVHFVFFDKNEELKALQEGAVEFAIEETDSTPNDEVEKAWRIYGIKHRLFVYNKPISDLEQLKSKKVGVLRNISYMDDVSSKLRNTQLLPFDNIEQMISSSLEGKISGFIGPASQGQHILLERETWPDFYQFSPLEFTVPAYVFIKKGNEGLKTKLLHGGNQIPYETFSKIESKWVLNPYDRIENAKKVRLLPQQINYISSLPELTIGYLKQWRPMEFQDKRGQFNGINADIVKHITKQLNLKVVAKPYDKWEDLLHALKSGEVDIIASVAKSYARQKDILFSDGYWPSSTAIVSNKEHAGIFSISQLSNKSIAVVHGYEIKEHLLLSDPTIRIVPVDSIAEGLNTVVNGKADVFINNLMVLADLIKRERYYDLNLSVLPEVAVKQTYFGVRKEYRELVPLLNIALNTLDQSQKKDLYLKWGSTINFTEYYKYRQWAVYLLIILILLSIAFIVYFYFSKKVQSEQNKRHQVEKRIQYLNTHDNLTGLLNRRLLDDRLTNAVLTHSRDQSRFAVMFIGLDNFKLVNEMKGYKSGDQLLKAVANALAGTIRRSDTLARFESDEFVILLNRTQDFDAVCQIAENAIAALNRVIEVQMPDIPVTVSIGIAFYPMDADNPVELLKYADKLMQVAKEKSESCYQTN